MSKRGFYIYLVFLADLIVFALSPFAVLGGFVVIAFLFLPLMFVLGVLGVDVSGQTIDGLIFSIFWGVTAVFALIAFWLFYQAADWTDKEERSKARVRSAGGFAMLVIPLLVYLFYKAMPGV